MNAGIYVGPAGQLVEIKSEQRHSQQREGYWADLFFSSDGLGYWELDCKVIPLLEGFEYLGEL